MGAELRQDTGRVGLPVLPVNEGCRPLAPGSEEATPRGFSPTRVREVPVQVVRTESEPPFAGDLVTDGIRGMGMHDHLRIPGGAGGEVEDRGLVGPRSLAGVLGR